MPREAGNGPRKPSRSPPPEPISAAGCCLGTLRAACGPSDRDQFDALYSGSRIDLSDGGVPAGLEALTGNRMAPSFVLPGGFPGEPETDHLDFLQVGWTHLLPAASGLGVIEVRYGYSMAHLDTSTVPYGQSRIELLGGRSQERHRLQTWLSARARRSKRRGSRPCCAPWGLAIRSLPVEDGKRPSRATASPLRPT